MFLFVLRKTWMNWNETVVIFSSWVSAHTVKIAQWSGSHEEKYVTVKLELSLEVYTYFVMCRALLSFYVLSSANCFTHFPTTTSSNMHVSPYVMWSEKSYTKSENLFLRKSNLMLLEWKISILSFEWKCVGVVSDNIFIHVLDEFIECRLCYSRI